MRYILCMLTAMIMAILPSAADAQETNREGEYKTGFTLSEREGTLEAEYKILSTDSNEVELVRVRSLEFIKSLNYDIPSTVIDPETGIEYIVTAIGNMAFNTLPEIAGSRSVSDEYEEYYYYLGSVSIPNTIKRIGSRAFSCTSLREVVIPNSVKEIGGGGI